MAILKESCAKTGLILTCRFRGEHPWHPMPDLHVGGCHCTNIKSISECDTSSNSRYIAAAPHAMVVLNEQSGISLVNPSIPQYHHLWIANRRILRVIARYPRPPYWMFPKYQQLQIRRETHFDGYASRSVGQDLSWESQSASQEVKGHN